MRTDVLSLQPVQNQEEGVVLEIVAHVISPVKKKWGYFFFVLSTGLFFLAVIVSILLATFGLIFLHEIGYFIEYGLRLLGYSSWKGYVYCQFMEYENFNLGKYPLALRSEIPGLKHEKYAAWLGFFACVGIILYLTCPPLAIAALLIGTWGFVLSNYLWMKSCQKNITFYEQQLTTQPLRPEVLVKLEREQMHAYYHYAILLTATSLVFALTTTVVIIFPPAIGFIGLTIIAGITLKSLVGFSLGAAAIGFLGQSFYKKIKREAEEKKLIRNNPAQNALHLPNFVNS